jgi:hypothetical protein
VAQLSRTAHIQCAACLRKFKYFGEYATHEHTVTCADCKRLMSFGELALHKCMANVKKRIEDRAKEARPQVIQQEQQTVACPMCLERVAVSEWAAHIEPCRDTRLAICRICNDVISRTSAPLLAQPCRHVMCETCHTAIMRTRPPLCPNCRLPLLDQNGRVVRCTAVLYKYNCDDDDDGNGVVAQQQANNQNQRRGSPPPPPRNNNTG